LKIFIFTHTQIDSLPADAREFVQGVIAKARELRPASGQSADMAHTRVQAAKIIAEFNELSDDAKRVLALMFPEIVAGIECKQYFLFFYKFHIF
jgi:hypothetical protein